MQGSVGEDSGRASGRGRRLIECAGQLCGCGLCGVVIASDEGKTPAMDRPIHAHSALLGTAT